MAAPAETRTPNLHRANQHRSSRVRMEAWRQWPLGGRTKPCSMKPVKNRLDSDRPSHGRPLHSNPPTSGTLSEEHQQPVLLNGPSTRNDLGAWDSTPTAHVCGSIRPPTGVRSCSFAGWLPQHALSHYPPLPLGCSCRHTATFRSQYTILWLGALCSSDMRGIPP